MIEEKFSDEAIEEIKKYALGHQSCESTAYNLWHKKLTEAFEPDPHAADVIVWSKQLGFGIPDVSAEEADRKADEAIAFFKNR